MGTVFKGNTSITKFNEFYFFENSNVPGNCFQGCTALREVSTPKNLVSVVGGTSSFKNNSNMVVYFNEGYQSLPYSSFGAGNSNVTLILPTTLTEIRSGAFYDGSGYILVVKATTPPNPGAVPNSRVTKVYVPDSSIDVYKASWTDVATKIYPISQYEGSIVSPVW